MDNRHASLPGLGVVERSNHINFHTTIQYGSRSFRLVRVTPKSWGTCLKSCDHVCRLHITYYTPVPERRVKTGVVAGIDRGVTNPTVVCKTTHDTPSTTSYDTATAFRTNQTCDDRMRRTVSHRNKHSNSTCKIQRKREKYNHGNVNDREYAEWLLAKKICEGVDMSSSSTLRP